jgi:uncharacterized protein DUF2490
VIQRFLRTLAIALVMTAPSQALEVFDQLWPELNIFVNTSQQSRLFFLAAGTRVRPDGYTDGQLGVHLDMYFGPLFKYRVERQPDAARTRLLTVRLGYLFGKTAPDSADPFVEHTPIIEVTPRFYLVKNILLTDRNRYDFRFVNGVYTPRYRNRVKLERTFQIGKRALTPYAYVEGFYDRRYDGFHRFRYTAGAEFQINQRFVLEGYYLRQQDFESRASRAQCCGDRITSLFPLKGTRS